MASEPQKTLGVPVILTFQRIGIQSLVSPGVHALFQAAHGVTAVEQHAVPHETVACTYQLISKGHVIHIKITVRGNIDIHAGQAYAEQSVHIGPGRVGDHNVHPGIFLRHMLDMHRVAIAYIRPDQRH